MITIKSDEYGKYWFLNGKRHREDGPAIEYKDGSKSWYVNGVCHRLDGPAIENSNGSKSWYIEGVKYSEESFKQKLGLNMKSESITDSGGTKTWLLNGKLHREDGPAVEWKDGTKIWYQNGELHREDGPAVEWPDGSKYWYIDGKRHRLDGPAIEHKNGVKKWFIEGVHYSEESFKQKLGMNMKSECRIDSEGTKRWILDGKFHRDDGPAVEWPDGDKEWYLNGKRHRLDGPAVEYINGDKEWYLNGKRHRLDGPACEYPDGSKVWYIEGVDYSEKSFAKIADAKIEAANLAATLEREISITNNEQVCQTNKTLMKEMNMNNDKDQVYQTSEVNPQRSNTLEEELAANKARVAELEAEINKKKGFMGHPTAVMMTESGYDAGLMLLSVEGMAVVKAMVREFLSEEIPKEFAALLDSEWGSRVIDIATPLVAHFVATQEWLPVGNDFIKAIAPSAFKGQMVIHGVEFTSIARKFVGRNANRLMKLKSMAAQFDNMEQAMATSGIVGMLSQAPTDWAKELEEASVVKEAVKLAASK